MRTITKLNLLVLWIGGRWWPRGWCKYSAISLSILIFSSCATPSPRCGGLGLSELLLLPVLLPFLEPDDLPLPRSMLSPELLTLIASPLTRPRRRPRNGGKKERRRWMVLNKPLKVKGRDCLTGPIKRRQQIASFVYWFINLLIYVVACMNFINIYIVYDQHHVPQLLIY
jgi:hypothetical protein